MNAGNIKVSVICLAYNHEKYIRDALDGFVMQKTTFPFEVLIHDDASTDNTAAIIREYEEKYPGIIKPVYQRENQHSKGVRIGNEILMPKAKGQYIAYCEGDDYWTDSNKLQKQVDFLDANPDYVACVHNVIQHDCRGLNPDVPCTINTEEHDVLFEDVILGMHNAYQTSSLVMRKEMNENLPDFYYIATAYGFGDIPKSIWLTLNGKIRFLSDAMSVYRFMSNSDSFSAKIYTNKEKFVRHHEGEIAMREAIKSHVSEEQVAFLDQTILKHRFSILMLQEKFDELRKSPYDTLWNQLGKKKRIKIWANQKLPKLYHLLKRMKNKMLTKRTGYRHEL